MNDKIQVKIDDIEFSLLVHENETLSNLIRQHGYHNRNDISLLKRFLSDKSTFLDIGANIGWYTVIASLLMGDSGKVISFEPEPKNVDLLKKNCFINNINCVKIIESIVLDEEKLMNLYLNSENFGDHSISEKTYLRTWSKKVDDNNKIVVKSITIDSIFTDEEWKNVSLIKIDTQGCESAVLRGMRGRLSKHRPPILLEFAPAHIYEAGYSAYEIFSFIENYNYIPYKICSNEVESSSLEFYTIDSMFLDTQRFKKTYESIDLLLIPQ